MLRPAREDDRDAIARVWLDGWRSTGIRIAGADATYAELRARVDDEIAAGWRVTVASLSDHVVGFAALRPDLAKLDQIFVAPAVQGQGLGRALFAVARLAMPGGFVLTTHADNARARRFYDALDPLRYGDDVHPRYGYPTIVYRFAGTPE